MRGLRAKSFSGQKVQEARLMMSMLVSYWVAEMNTTEGSISLPGHGLLAVAKDFAVREAHGKIHEFQFWMFSEVYERAVTWSYGKECG